MKKKNNKTVLIAVIGIFVALVVYAGVSNLVVANNDRGMDKNMMENMDGMMKSMSGMMEGMKEMHEECMKMMKGGMSGMMGSGTMDKPEGMSQEEHESHHK